MKGTRRREEQMPPTRKKEEPLAHKETRDINILRGVVALLLVSIAAAASVIVFKYAQNDERDAFHTAYHTNAHRIVDNFHDQVERKMGAINSLSTAITSYATDTQQSFPFVTIPDFELRGCDARIQADAAAVTWAPLVTDDNRAEWEEYALWNRSHVDVALAEDVKRRNAQDELYGLSGGRRHSRRVNQQEQDPPRRGNTRGGGQDRRLQVPFAGSGTLLGDGSGFHPHIWSNGVVTEAGDEPPDSGPYLPLWQTTPVLSTKQFLLNLNVANTQLFREGILQKLITTKEAIMGSANIPGESAMLIVENALRLGQYRHNLAEYADEPITFFNYPVFDTFDNDSREVAGILSTSFLWKLFFSRVLPESAVGYICVIENSYDQVFSFRVDGRDVTYLGGGDRHDEDYDYLEESADVNAFVQSQAGPQTRSYLTVPLNKDNGSYRLRIYPSRDTEDSFVSNRPAIYTTAVLLIFLLTTAVLVCLDRSVTHRQQILMERAVHAAQEAATAEREINEYLSHEVRNPIAAAITAHGFIVSSFGSNGWPSASKTATEPPCVDASVWDDLQIIGSCLLFVDDFLRSILDLYRAHSNKIQIHLAPADVLKDILEPVCSILYQRGGVVDVSVDCPSNLVVMTDTLRLKQIMMNLGRNSIKFTTSGFVRFSASVVNGFLELTVSDSGCGIPESKRGEMLFEKFQPSLDKLSQGTGVGLALCKNLVNLLDGDIFLDESYSSGIEGSPGTKFVVRLNAEPMSQVLELTAMEGSVNFEERDSALPENLSALFVDDDNMLRRLFSRSISKVAPSWKITEAASGEAALRLIDQGERFSVIFMDQYMAATEKQLLGSETTTRLREKGVTSTICGLSANDMESVFLGAGADCFQLKPFPCKRDEMEKVLFGILQAGEHRNDFARIGLGEGDCKEDDKV